MTKRQSADKSKKILQTNGSGEMRFSIGESGHSGSKSLSGDTESQTETAQVELRFDFIESLRRELAEMHSIR